MFEKDRFIDDCKRAVGEGQKAIRELVQEAVSDPAGVMAELGEPTQAFHSLTNQLAFALRILPAGFQLGELKLFLLKLCL